MNLKEQNYDLTESECPDCEDGFLWVNSFELVCEECGIAYRNNENHDETSYTVYEEFYMNRSIHRYDSGKVRMIGGFEEAYPYADPKKINDNPGEIAEPYQ